MSRSFFSCPDRVVRAALPSIPIVGLIVCWLAGLIAGSIFGVIPARAQADGNAEPVVTWEGVADPAAPTLDAGEGHVWLRWSTESPGSVEGFELERRTPGLERVTRRFAEPATFVSGLPEGVTEIRVRALRDGAHGPWSVPLRVKVTYPSKALVQRLSLLGVVLFFATVILIVAGHQRFAASNGGES